MQNKTNTILLIILIILVAIGVWFLAKNTGVQIDTDKKPVVEEDTPVVKKDNVPVPNPTPKPIINQVLQTIFNKNKNAKIDECLDGGKVYYSTAMNAYDG